MGKTIDVVRIPCEQCLHNRVCKHKVAMENMKVGAESELLVDGEPICEYLLDIAFDCKYKTGVTLL